MEKVIHVLAIDDHSVVVEGYYSIFKNLIEPSKIKFSKAYDCRSGFEVITNNNRSPFNVAVLDYSIPPFPDKKLFSGEDLAMLIRESMPLCRIIMMTMHKEADIISRILQKIKPEGFINKSDCSADDLIEGFKTVLDGEGYFSKTVSDFLDMQAKGIVLDDVDIRIIQLLAKGVKNKNLDKYILLSTSGIEKRKYRIKRLLEIEGDDEALINEARLRGYI